MISKERLDEFKELYRKHYGINLTDAETLDKATRFVSLIGVVLKESVKHAIKYRSRDG